MSHTVPSEEVTSSRVSWYCSTKRLIRSICSRVICIASLCWDPQGAYATHSWNTRLILQWRNYIKDDIGSPKLNPDFTRDQSWKAETTFHYCWEVKIGFKWVGWISCTEIYLVIGVYWLFCLETFQQTDMGMNFKCPQGQRVLDNDPFIPHAWPIFHTGLCNMHRQCITRMETYGKTLNLF